MSLFGSQTIERILKYEENAEEDALIAKTYYERERAKLSPEQQELIDQAIEQRYILLYDHAPKIAEALERVCVMGCAANKTPMVMIGPIRRNTKRSKTHIRFYLEWASLFQISTNSSIYIPDLCDYKLKWQDEIFHLIMLLAVEYTWSPGHIHLKCVPVDHAEEVARQILAMYDRACQKHKEKVDKFLSGEVLSK